MRVKLCAASLLAAVALAPVGVFAQQNPAAPDGTSMEGTPAAGAAGAVGVVDACGTPLTPGTPAAAAGTAAEVNPKDDNAAGQQQDLSSVSGTIVHVEGNLMLVSVPAAAATGNDHPTGTQASTPSMAVVQLPDGCASPALSDGSRVTVVGMPTNQGILAAQTIQTD